MKAVALGLVAAAAGLGMAIASRAVSVQVPGGRDFPAGCVIAAAVAPGYLPRAGLALENRRGHAIRVWLEARAGLSLNRAALATVGAYERVMLPHALPAGRNILVAEDAAGGRRGRVVYVNNRGGETCVRQYLWRVE